MLGMESTLETAQLMSNDVPNEPQVKGPVPRQYIVVDRSLGMSPGKLAAQVAHASVACLLAGTQRYVDGEASSTPIGLEWGGCLARTAVDASVLAAWVRQGEPKIVLAVDGERAPGSSRPRRTVTRTPTSRLRSMPSRWTRPCAPTCS